jgi:HAD superfamily hydrolase (TIGR01509 family)
MIKGAIFDVDGTLLDSMSIWENIGRDYLKSIGYEPRKELREEIRNMSLYQAACYYKTEYGVKLTLQEIIDGVNNMLEQFYKYEAKLKYGVKDFLQNLYDSGVKMCIATATDKTLVQSALERCGADKFFSEIFTCASVGHGKNEPFIYRTALEHLGTEKSSSIVFEDAYYAIKTLKADNFITAAVYDKYEKKQEEIKSIADFYMNDFSNYNLFLEFANRFN